MNFRIRASMATIPMTGTPQPSRYTILIINPNTSTQMTENLKPMVDRLSYTDVDFDYFTAPSKSIAVGGRPIGGIPSINSGEDSALSALHAFEFVKPIVHKYDAFLVACFAAHPMVGQLKQMIAAEEESQTRVGSDTRQGRRRYVTGIFEASLSASLDTVCGYSITSANSLHKAISSLKFGIISTGSVWEAELTKAVTQALVNPANDQWTTNRFAGVETTGLTALELHTAPPEEVRRRIIEATERLVKKSEIKAICLGCVGMAGMDSAVREGCVNVLGEGKGHAVRIIDGVVAGIGLLVNYCKAGF